MTDNEIIKALEDEIRRANYIESYYIDCVDIGVFQNALDLINRQKAENDRLEKELMKCKLEKEMLYQTVEEIKSEAIKEFAEKLENEINCRTTLSRQQDKNVIHIIHNLLKEMAGEEE